jgi:hypothetical protein
VPRHWHRENQWVWFNWRELDADYVPNTAFGLLVGVESLLSSYDTPPQQVKKYLTRESAERDLGRVVRLLGLTG